MAVLKVGLGSPTFVQVGSKRIFVLYNINHKIKNGPAAPAPPEPKTKWVMHQYDLASEGSPHNFLVSKIFWQKQPKVKGKTRGDHSAVDASLAEVDPWREQSEAETLSGQKRALPDSCPSGGTTVRGCTRLLPAVGDGACGSWTVHHHGTHVVPLAASTCSLVHVWGWGMGDGGWMHRLAAPGVKCSTGQGA